CVGGNVVWTSRTESVIRRLELGDSLRQQHLQLRATDLREQALVLTENSVGEGALRRLELKDLLLDRFASDDASGDEVLRLSNTMCAVNRLCFHRRIPPRIENEHILCRGEIETMSTGLEADEEHRTGRVRLKAIDARLAIRRLAVEVLIDDA